jgi:NAD(P)-dependent dehydrogenase (short-subunit alcohol dehydrogenase family)
VVAEGHSWSLEGRTALVTGASSGIGRATARVFAAAGAHVFVHYFRGTDRARAVAKAIDAEGGSATLLGADLAAPGAAAEVARALSAAGRGLDILVNNVGDPIRRVAFAEVDEALLDQTVALNFKSPFLLTQALLPLLAERQGVIVNVSTALTRRAGSGGNLHYAAVKGAVNILTAGLAVELAPLGIRVNCIAPGAIDTELQARLSTPERLERSKARTLMHRLGKPEEIAQAILFAAAPASAYMTGQTIFVDGG